MEKRQLIDEIRRLNATATPRFLAQFDTGALRQYLDHLNDARTRPGKMMAMNRRPSERILV